MFFRIEPQIFEAAPGLYTGIVAAWNVDNETPQPAVRQLPFCSLPHSPHGSWR